MRGPAERPAPRGLFTRPLGKCGRFLSVAVVLVLGLLVSGCGAFGGVRQITLEHLGWDENVAVSTLTKVLLEEELSYEVELKLAKNLDAVFRDVAEGNADAFQDVWLPNHDELVEGVDEDVELLDPWFEGETSYGIAVPHYMQVESLKELDDAGTDKIIGIEPRSSFHQQITEEVIPAYDLDFQLVESSTPAMLAQLDDAYRYKEPIVFLAWSPHWMNEMYRFRYLDDPKDAQGVFNDPARLASIVRNDLAERDPGAYELLRTVSLDDEQVVEIELSINENGPRNPTKGVRAWVSQNQEVVQPWVEAAREADVS